MAEWLIDRSHTDNLDIGFPRILGCYTYPLFQYSSIPMAGKELNVYEEK
jgi:hypothetical protein